MALAGLDRQIVDAVSLVNEPKVWKAQLQTVAEQYPDAAQAVHWLTRELPQLKPDLRQRRTASFRRR